MFKSTVRLTCVDWLFTKVPNSIQSVDSTDKFMRDAIYSFKKLKYVFLQTSYM